MDNFINSTGQRRGVGEESLEAEIRSRFELAKNRKESLRITLGSLNEQKLLTFHEAPKSLGSKGDSGEEPGRERHSPPFKRTRFARCCGRTLVPRSFEIKGSGGTEPGRGSGPVSCAALGMEEATQASPSGRSSRERVNQKRPGSPTSR